MRTAFLLALLCVALLAGIASAGPSDFGLRVGTFQPMGSDLDLISNNWLFFGLEYGSGGVPTPWATIPVPFGDRTVTVDYMNDDGYDGLNYYKARMVPVLYRIREPINESFYWAGGVGLSFNDFRVNNVGRDGTDFAWEAGLGMVLGESALVELNYCDLGGALGLDASGARLSLTWFF